MISEYFSNRSNPTRFLKPIPIQLRIAVPRLRFGCWLPGRVIEAGRIAAQHFLKREGKLFIRVFPDKPISKKPLETRMGTGKADVDYWAARVKAGTILFEIAGVTEAEAKKAMIRVAMKMPVRCRLVGRRVVV